MIYCNFNQNDFELTKRLVYQEVPEGPTEKPKAQIINVTEEEAAEDLAPRATKKGDRMLKRAIDALEAGMEGEKPEKPDAMVVEGNVEQFKKDQQKVDAILGDIDLTPNPESDKELRDALNKIPTKDKEADDKKDDKGRTLLAKR